MKEKAVPIGTAQIEKSFNSGRNEKIKDYGAAQMSPTESETTSAAPVPR